MLLLLVLLVLYNTVSAQTINGYDVGGKDPVCWMESKVGEMNLLSNCPLHIRLDLEPYEVKEPEEEDPSITVDHSSAYRVDETYLFNMTIRVDFSGEEEVNNFVVGPEEVTLQLVACHANHVGFCSPFSLTATPDSHNYVFANSTTLEADLTKSPLIVEDHIGVTIPREPGPYSIIGVLSIPSRHYTAAVASKNGLIFTFKEEANKLKVQPTTVLVSYMLMGVAGLVQLYLLCSLIYHSSNQVMKFSQHYFLIIMVLCGILATASSFVFNPKSAHYCNLEGPFILLPLHIMFSIVLGRLWRIQIMVSPLLKGKDAISNGKENTVVLFLFKTMSHFTFDSCMNRSPTTTETISRRVTSNATLFNVIMFLSAPQLALQVARLQYETQVTEYWYNQDESIARIQCSSCNLHYMKWTSYGLLVFLIVTVLIVAHGSRNLPSLFNESRALYNTGLSTVLTLAVGAAIIAVTTEPTATPEIEYMVRVLMTLSFVLNISVTLIWPKLELIWKGTNIIVSKLVSDIKASSAIGSVNESSEVTPIGTGSSYDSSAIPSSNAEITPVHRQRSPDHTTENSSEESYRKETGWAPADISYGRAKEFKTSNIETSDYNASDIVPGSQELSDSSSSASPQQQVFNPSLIIAESEYISSEIELGDNAVPTIITKKKGKKSNKKKKTHSGTGFNTSQVETESHFIVSEFDSPDQVVLSRKDSSQGGNKQVRFANSTKIQRDRIRKDKQPPRKMIVKMRKTQNSISKTIDTLMSGVQVDENDWENLQKSCIDLGNYFNHSVKFDWEQNKQHGDDAV